MSSKDRKAWEKQQRENRIIDMAEPVFFKKGYEGTTIIEIAKASGYNKRSIYLYFKDKEEIFLAVVLRGLVRMHDMLEKVSTTSDIRDMGQAFFDFSLAHPDYLKLIMVYEANTCVYQSSNRLASTGSDERPFYRKKCQDKTDAIAAVMTQCLEHAMAQNQIRTDLSPEQLMLILWGQVFGVMQIILMRQQDFKKTYGISYKALFNAFLDMASLSLSPDVSQS
ncbi:MAG: TetR/AcrR family transcriptional regulator [Desulfobacter sp.]|nr:TetR/AcrR family transcriptional regulator [Desulfobacter sp.]WDP85547.1 MAG: TetR/AcrR family transcriptional regulator [Desulfobacter sp.]